MTKRVDQEVLLDENLEKGFDEVLEDLQKSLNPDSEELSKADKDDEEKKPSKSDVTDDEDEEEEDEYEEDDVEKSIEDILRDDEEASAAMDVSDFLLQFTKAIDETMTGLMSRVANVEKLTKSIGQMTVKQAQLSKSMSETVAAIGGQPLPPKSVVALNKASRFGEENDQVEASPAEVLIKSRDWLQKGKVNLVEAGMIEGRVNKGLIGKMNDPLDAKIINLLKEESK